MSNPNEVKRYDFGEHTGFPKGDYVKYSSYQSLELENKLLREALEKYGKHIYDCAKNNFHPKVNPCTCGLEEASKEGGQ